MTAAVEIRVLGSLEIVDENGVLALGAAKLRRLLAALAMRAGDVRPGEDLIDAIWGRSPPRSAEKLLQVYVSQLRKALPVRISRRGSGYALAMDGIALDATRFEHLVGDGRAALRQGNAALATSLLSRALGLWRGPAYADFAFDDFARLEAERLEELRIVADEERIEAELALGRHAQLLPELRGLAAAHPLRERLQAQAMLALYRCGRQSEALDLYAATRRKLRDELGLDPSLELRDLERRILQHDPGLAVAPSAAPQADALPSPPNRLLGRDKELEQLRELLRRDDVRLLVLTGAGGSGKTRLALEAAREAAPSFANGAAFVGLAPLRNPALVVGAIARALGLQDEPGREPLETLIAALEPRELLLLVDNAEHLRAAAPVFVELLARTPRLTLLVTSRVVLHLSGEHVFPVEPLSEDAAVELFLERARGAEPRFRFDDADRQAARTICARVDGLPLAVELAAARTRMLTPAELAARLGSRLPLLTGGPRDLPARQQTMRATLSWSYDLLDEDEQRDFRRLAVFAGGCTLEAAEAVCDTPLERLTSLVEQNLLHRTVGSHGSRYGMLETVREYAAAKLDQAEWAPLQRRHAEYFLALAAEAGPHLKHSRQSVWGERLRAESENIDAALAWTIEGDRVDLGLRLAAALHYYWLDRDFAARGTRWLDLLLDRSAGAPADVRANALLVLANLASVQGNLERCEGSASEALELFRGLGDDSGAAWALVLLATVHEMRGDFEKERVRLEEALPLFRALGDELGIRRTLHLLGNLAREAGDLERAGALLREAVDLARAAQDRFHAVAVLHALGDIELERGSLGDARSLYVEALQGSREIAAHRVAGYCLAGLSAVAATQGTLQLAADLWAAVAALERTVGFRLRSPSRERYERRLRQETLHPRPMTAETPDRVIEEALERLA